jgi:RNA polymerase sigma factor (sigma-70 family)
MTDTQKLLADYVSNGSEQAFRELVARYVDLVHSTAVRLTGGDTHLAQDVAQMVFVHLARKARTLPPDVMLGGWLHRDTCFAASKVMRGERRRQFREKQAVAMNEIPDHSEANLARIAPVLDEAINQLSAKDRTAILLRFFEQHDLRSVGEAMGSTENAAQKRVSNALEELRALLKHRGIAFSAAALGTALAAQAVSAAPAGSAIRISTAALASAATGGGAAFTLLKIMSMTKIQFGLAAMIVAGAATTLVIQRQTQFKLDEENQALRKQVARLQSEQEVHKPRLARAPRQIAARPAMPAADVQATNMFERLSKQSAPVKLTREQVEAYLKANGRNAATLLAAFRASDDPALLQEAMDKFPNDPRVDLAAIFKSGSTPEEQRQWLNNFEQSAPNNSLANYLSALNYFQSGQTDQAAQELSAAAGKSQFQNYALESWQGDVEAYLAAGYSMADAKVFGPTINPQTPIYSALKELGLDMVGLANGYQQAGDPASAQSAFQMTINLGQNLDAPNAATTVTQLVGMNIERIALNAMDPASPYGDSGQTVQDQLNQLTQQRAALMDIGNQFNALAPMMSDQDWINYRDRDSALGQLAAEQWAISKFGQQ